MYLGFLITENLKNILKELWATLCVLLMLSCEEFHKLRHGAPSTGSKCRKTVDLPVLDGRKSSSSGSVQPWVSYYYWTLFKIHRHVTQIE